MNNEFVCQFFAFKGEDEYVPAANVLVEVSDIPSPGVVEISFNAPIPGSPRMYLQLDLAEVIRRSVGEEK